MTENPNNLYNPETHRGLFYLDSTPVPANFRSTETPELHFPRVLETKHAHLIFKTPVGKQHLTLMPA